MKVNKTEQQNLPRTLKKEHRNTNSESKFILIICYIR